jgi:3-hydroxyacyl-CoA dehydrogenase
MAELDKVQKIAVIGCGIMGTGIAQAFLLGGYDTVVLCDINDAALTKSRKAIEALFKALSSEAEFKAYISGHPFLGHFSGVDFSGLITDPKRVGIITDGITKEEFMNRLRCETDFIKAVSDADFVIEAVSEKLETKQEVFKKLSESTPTHTVCASNTSTLPVTEIGRLSNRPEKVIGMHFHGFSQAFNRLVEIMGGENTSDDSQEIGRLVGKSLPSIGGERLAVRLEKEAAGFIANRIAAPASILSTRLLDRAIEQDISVEQLHAAGVDLRVIDVVGLDTIVNAMHSYHHYLSPDFAPARLLVEQVSAGKLGRKTGQGLYRWDESGNAVIRDVQVEEKTLNFMAEFSDPELAPATRLNEACRLLEMGAVKGYEIINEVERIGEGHPGVFEYGSEKHAEWAEKLEHISDKISKPYLKPCEMMRSGKFKDYP